MLFTSPIFLLVFFPLVLLLNFSTKGKTRNLLLLIMSLVFYAWGEPIYILLMLFSIIINYFIGRMLGYKRTKIVLAIGVIINLGLLLFFKYFNFAADNANVLIQMIKGGKYPFPYIMLPIGISFYTFQGMSYIVDVYREEVKHRKALYHWHCIFPCSHS